jgi:hypothetical protein
MEAVPFLHRVQKQIGVPSLMPIASVAKSGRPILMTTSLISGKARAFFNVLADLDRVSQRDARQLAGLHRPALLDRPVNEKPLPWVGIPRRGSLIVICVVIFGALLGDQ